MKIISIGPAYPYRGGLASFNDRLAQQFSVEGHEVESFQMLMFVGVRVVALCVTSNTRPI